ncbi:threonine-phosphate decarboxylase CobD [Roseinatronobacter alkalisoli]|uniref:threonine-phosphate decarboxylase n=1 Tax=Roseinatronobacter alkalisoli TaxID=3028235 RepID=A0ABT5T9Y9_9RHOB|nr:threonine-phosphate decarboxylase CobD [Roseinatronobacter sp. HJB301]MDD7971206.1 threonine-phosphate decarboxylase CobD [Roseinatronobacter sp. HJB301]
MRDHGGNIDTAMARYGGDDWIDLSTGINRRPYPMPTLPDSVWHGLPTARAQGALVTAAAQAWGADTRLAGLAFGGAQAAIQLVPHLAPKGRAHVLAPSYNEHAACLNAAGWTVQDSATPQSMAGADLAVLVNPNNPDGRCWSPADLLELAQNVGFLVVDESFGDVTPDLSLLPHAGGVTNLLVLRSFGKFYGLAGLRLGFAFGAKPVITRLADMAGPWPVSGAAICVGCHALADRNWADAMRVQLGLDAARADDLARAAGWTSLGGTSLFRLYDTEDADVARDHLAGYQIWSRVFPYSSRWLRLGLPGPEREWQRLEQALARTPTA